MNRYLLDKGVIRRTLETFLKIDLDLDLTVEQEQALDAFRYVVIHHKAFITIETFNLVRSKLAKIPYSDMILFLSGVLVPTRYSRRWARRLRELNFSREDAKLMATATFGTDKIIGGTIIGVDAIITFDKRLVRKYGEGVLIRKKFREMIANLQEPYSRASIPEVVTVERLLAEI